MCSYNQWTIHFSLLFWIWNTLKMWNGVFPAISVNKDVTAIGDLGLQMWMSEPQVCWNGEQCLRSSPCNCWYCGECAGGLRPWETRSRVLAPDSWDAYEGSDFSVPRHLHLPIQRRVLYSLIWDTCFFLIHNNPWCCTLWYNLTPSPACLEQFFQGYLRCCLPGLKS